MKLIITGLIFGFLFVGTMGGMNDMRKHRRMCRHTCQRFSSFLNLRNFQTDLTSNKDSEDTDSVESLFDKFCEENKNWDDEYVMHLRHYLNDFKDGKSLRKVCQQSNMCRDLMKQKRQESMKYTQVESCKLCQQVMNIVGAAAEFGNTTWYNVGQFTIQMCEKYARHHRVKRECVNVINKLDALKDIFGEKLSHLQVCKGIGMCGNASSDIMKTCIYGMKKISPWDTAFSVARDMAEILTPKGTLSDAVRKVMNTAFFNQVGKCLWLVKSQMVGSPHREARSVKEEDDCETCDKISKGIWPSITKAKNVMSDSINTLCKSTSDKSKCGLIQHFADTLEHIIPSMKKDGSCGFFPCDWMSRKIFDKKKSKSCVLCQNISNLVMKYIDYLDATVEQIGDAVDEICEETAGTEAKAACKRVKDILDTLTKDFKDRFENLKICKDIGVC